MSLWTAVSTDVFLATIAQVLPIFLLAMAADAIAIRFAVNAPSRWTQRLLYINIGYLMISEFWIILALSQPVSDRVPAWIPLLQLAIALGFSYFVLLLRWQGKLAKQIDSQEKQKSKPKSKRTRKGRGR